MNLKKLNGAAIAQDTDTGDIYVIDANGGTKKLTDYVPPQALSYIFVATAPTTTSYVEGQSFSKAGMVVKGVYVDGTMVEIHAYETALPHDIPGYTYAPYAALATTDDKITITFKGLTCQQAITVVAKTLESIEIYQEPTTTTYAVGETFDPAGMLVKAIYNDESESHIPNTDWTYAPTEALTATDTTITVSYTEGDVTKTDTQAIEVS